MVLAEIDRFLLGDNPFIGVDHLSQEKARQTQMQMNLNKIKTVIDTSLDNGAQGITFSTSPLMYQVLKELKSQGYDRNFGVYPLIPDAYGYVRTAAEKGVLGLMTSITDKLSWSGKTKILVGGGFSLLTFDPKKLLLTFVDSEVDGFLNACPTNAKLKTVLLHEILVDSMLSFNLTDLVTAFVDHVNDHYGVRAGFATKNFSKFILFLQTAGVKLDDVVVMSSFNNAGFYMNPSKMLCEEALDNLDGNIKVIAMNTLSAGYTQINEAINYLKYHPKIDCFAIGTSTPEHAKATFSLFNSELKI
jgi:hypothetical protein